MSSKVEKLVSASSPTHKQMNKHYQLKTLTFSYKVYFVPYICNVICEDAASVKSLILNLYLLQSVSQI